MSADLIVLVVICVPVAWSAGLAALRRLQAGAADIPDDAAEKRQLLILLAPVVAGIVLLALGRFMPVNLPLPQMEPVDFPVAAAPVSHAAAASVKSTINYGHWLAVILLAVCAAGIAWRVARLSVALVKLHCLITTAHASEVWGQGVRVTDALAPPLAWGRRTILLPKVLIDLFMPTHMQLILRHEREHLKRGDSLYFILLSWLDAVLWFNPFLRRQTHLCRVAAELACDAAVIAAAPEMRGVYAELLVKTLKHTAGDVRQYAPAAFSPAKSGDYRMRIREIMHAQPNARKSSRRWLYGAAAVLAVPVAFAQLAWSQNPVAHKAVALIVAPVEASVPNPAPAASEFPVTPMEGPVSSGFGMRLNPLTHKTAMHDGVDITATIGTPVHAPADGKVITATTWDNYGKILEIDHGGGRVTRYIHLDSIDVAVGDSVKAGQVVAKSGNTGLSTGPHLHVGLFIDGKAVDPTGPLHLPKAAG